MMEKQFNILVATDYSESVSSAEHYAVHFAKYGGFRLRFIHVFPPLLVGTSASFDPEKIDYNPLQFEFSRLKKHVSGILSSLSIHEDKIDFECVIREGNVEKQILEEARECEANLIVTGTHGSGVLHSWMFGSHTWDLIKHSDIPVLAIPENAKFRGIEHIAFATEYRKSEIAAIHFLTRFVQKFNPSITVVHIAGHRLSEGETPLAENFRKEIRENIPYEKLDVKLIHSDTIINGLNEYCNREKVDVLVISPEHLSLVDRIINPFETSTSRRISFYTRFPLLVLPDFKDTLYADMIKMI